MTLMLLVYSFLCVLLLMIAAENDPHDGKRKCETLWPIFKIAHQKSRYIFDLYHRRKEISKELFEFCLDQGYADRNLIAKWKKVYFCLSYVIWFLVVAALCPFKVILKCGPEYFLLIPFES